MEKKSIAFILLQSLWKMEGCNGSENNWLNDRSIVRDEKFKCKSSLIDWWFKKVRKLLINLLTQINNFFYKKKVLR